jgi:hypothetical protein
VSRVEVATGAKSTKFTTGAVIGLGVGALLGLGVAAVYAEATGDPEDGLIGLLTIPAGAVVGLIGGGIIGSQIKSDKWSDVPLDQLSANHMPTHSAPVLLGVRVRF